MRIAVVVAVTTIFLGIPVVDSEALAATEQEPGACDRPAWLIVVGDDVALDEVEGAAARDVANPPHPRRPPTSFAVQVDGWAMGSGVLEYYGFFGDPIDSPVELRVEEGEERYHFQIADSDPEDPLTLRVWSGGQLIYWKGKGRVTNVDTNECADLPQDVAKLGTEAGDRAKDGAFRGVKSCGSVEVEVNFVYDASEGSITDFRSENRCRDGGTHSLWEAKVGIEVDEGGLFYFADRSGNWVRGRLGVDGVASGTFNDSSLSINCNDGFQQMCTEWLASRDEVAE